MRSILCLLSFMGAVPVLAAEVIVTSANLPSLVQERGVEAAASTKDIEASRRREGSFKRSFVPELRAYVASESFKLGEQDQKQQPVYGAEVNVNLYNGGKDRLEEETRRLESQRVESGSKLNTASDLLRARQLYWNILFHLEEIKVLEGSLKLNSENLKLAQRRISGGLATQSDRFEFEMRDVDLKRGLAQANFEKSKFERELRVLLNLESDATLRFNEKMDHEHNFEGMIQASEEASRFLFDGDLKLAEIQAKKASQENRELLPKLDVYAGYNQFNEREKEYSAARDRTEAVVGLRLSAELGRAFESRAESQSLALQAEASKMRAERLRLSVMSDLESRRSELRMLHDQVHEAEENIKRAESYYKLTQSEYSRGVKNSPDVLGASEKLAERQQRFIEILKDFQMGKAELFARIGK